MINILPYKEKKQIKQLRFLRMATVSLFVGSILVLIASVLFWPTLITVNSRFAIISAEMQKLEASGVFTKPVDVLNLEYRARAITAQFATKLPPSPMKYIEIVRGHAVLGITLQGFTVDDATIGSVRVVGTAQTRQQLQEFIARLESDDMITTVDSPVSNFVKNTKSDFGITVTFAKPL